MWTKERELQLAEVKANTLHEEYNAMRKTIEVALEEMRLRVCAADKAHILLHNERAGELSWEEAPKHSEKKCNQ
jgi:hypothetical protein